LLRRGLSRAATRRSWREPCLRRRGARRAPSACRAGACVDRGHALRPARRGRERHRSRQPLPAPGNGSVEGCNVQVRTRFTWVLMKLGLRDRVQAVIFASEAGWNRPAVGAKPPPHDHATSQHPAGWPPPTAGRTRVGGHWAHVEVVDRAVLLGALRRGRVHCASVASHWAADPRSGRGGGQLRQPDLPDGRRRALREQPRPVNRSIHTTDSVSYLDTTVFSLRWRRAPSPCNEQGSTSTRWWRGRIWVVQGRNAVSTHLRGVESMRPAKEVDGGSGMRLWAPAPTSSPRWGAASIPSAVSSSPPTSPARCTPHSPSTCPPDPGVGWRPP
jgi:hypothetical protein